MSNPLVLLAQGAASLIGLRPFEAPPYRVLATLADGVEVRQYGRRLAAETLAEDSSEAAARGAAFQRLARYIFGANRSGTKIAMTAPVTMDARQGAMTMRFFLPASVTAAAAPVPQDARVRLVPLGEEVFAVLRLSGQPWRAVARGKGRLLRALQGSGWQATGTPEAWFYDPPTTPGPLRRNEVVVAVSRTGGDAGR